MSLLISYGGVGVVFVCRNPAVVYEREMASPSIPRPPPRPSLLLVLFCRCRCRSRSGYALRFSAPIGLKRLELAGKAESRNREMAGNLWFIIFVVLVLPAISTPVSSNEDNYFHCERVVKNWVESSCESGQDEDKSTLKDLLFFLHVPRTGGHTYFHCFFKKTVHKCSGMPTLI